MSFFFNPLLRLAQHFVATRDGEANHEFFVRAVAQVRVPFLWRHNGLVWIGSSTQTREDIERPAALWLWSPQSDTAPQSTLDIEQSVGSFMFRMAWERTDVAQRGRRWGKIPRTSGRKWSAASRYIKGNDVYYYAGPGSWFACTWRINGRPAPDRPLLL